jgi:hypothetical protein
MLQLPQVDPLDRTQIVADYVSYQLAPALTFLKRFKSALELNALFFGRQVKQRVGRSDGDHSVAHGLGQLRAATALNSGDSFIFGCARQENPPCQETE